MALLYTDSTGLEVYVSIKKVNINNKTKVTTILVIERAYQAPTATTQESLSLGLLDDFSLEYDTVGVGTSEALGYAYSKLKAMPKYAGATSV